MRTIFACSLLAAAFTLAAADLAQAQDMGGMGGGDMGGGGMGGGGGGMGGGGRGGGHRGQRGQGQGQGAPSQTGQTPMARPAPTAVPIAMRLNGVVTVAGETKTLSKASVTAVKPDQSAIYVERNAQLTLDGMQLASSTTLTTPQDGHDYGLAAALLIASHATATMTGGAVTTAGNGITAIHLTDPGSHAVLNGVTISTRAANARGIAIAGGASLAGNAIQVTTESDHAAALSVEGGQATVTGGSFTTGGPLSPALALAGDVTASNITATAGHADAVTIDGANRIALTNATLRGDGVGIRLFTSDAPATAGAPDGPPPPGGPSGGPGGTARGGGMLPATAMLTTPETRKAASVTVRDGAIHARAAVFTVSNVTGDLTLTHVDIASDSGIVLKAVAGATGPLGRNGGDAHIEAHNQVLTGDFITDVISSIRLDLRDGSHLTGKTTSNVDVVLDVSSSWTLTDDTRVGKLLDAAISGDTVANITGNGHVLTYDQRYNPALGGKTYQLAGGGTLVPGSGL